MHLAAVWEPSPAQPPWRCVCPQGERDSVWGLKGLIHRPRERAGIRATRPGRTVGLNRSTLPTEGHRPFPDRLWCYHGLVDAKGIHCLLWTTCQAPPPPQGKAKRSQPGPTTRTAMARLHSSKTGSGRGRSQAEELSPLGPKPQPQGGLPPSKASLKKNVKRSYIPLSSKKSIVAQGDPKVTCSGVAGNDLQFSSIKVPGIWNRKPWCGPPEPGTALTRSSGVLGP